MTGTAVVRDVPAAPATDTLRAVARAALWGLLGAKILAAWGVQWDIQWHVFVGRDTFWIAPHLLTYSGVTLSVLLSFGVLAWQTLAARRARASAWPAMRLFGLTGTPGFHLAAWGIALTILAAPVDDLWHRLFGLDVTLWSPPHLLGLFGAVVNSAACLLIAGEVYADRRGARLAALVVGGALLYSGTALALSPGFRLAYLHGGVAFDAYAMLAALLLPPALVATARVSGLRWAPLAMLVVVLVVHVAGVRIARAGFDVLQPVSVIDEEIAKDPTSPIAVAQLIARKNQTPPGGPGAGGQIASMLPAALLVLVDARRRPYAATLVWAVTLFAVWHRLLAGSPAFAPMTPGIADTQAALAITAVAALVGAAIGVRLASVLAPSRPV